MPVLYLTEAEVAPLLTMDLALRAVEAAFRKMGIDEAVNVPRQRCQTDLVMLHVLPAAAKTLGAVGFKAYTTTKAGAKFHITLFDSRTGEMTAILEADALGQYRTGAASGVATKKLARPDAATVGLYGTGKQARTQLLALCKVRPITLAKVFAPRRRPPEGVRRTVVPGNRRRGGAGRSAGGRGAGPGHRHHRDDGPRAVLFGEWLAEGAHVNLTGSNFLAKAEADAEVFRRAAVVTVDSKDQAKLEAGDFVAALNSGALHWADVCDYPKLHVGKYPGRESPQDVTVFKSLGLGVQDIALAVRIVELAKQQASGGRFFEMEMQERG